MWFIGCSKKNLISTPMGLSTGASSPAQMLTQDLGDTKSFIGFPNLIWFSRQHHFIFEEEEHSFFPVNDAA